MAPAGELDMLRADFPDLQLWAIGNYSWWLAAVDTGSPPFLRRPSCAELRSALESRQRGENPPVDLPAE